MSYGAELIADYAYEIDMAKKEYVCGRCKWNRRGSDGFYCGNKCGEHFGDYTAYDDACKSWKEKE